MPDKFIREWSSDERTFDRDNQSAHASWTARDAAWTSNDDVQADPAYPATINALWLDDPASPLRCERHWVRRTGPKMWRVEATWSVPDGGSQHTGSQTEDDPTATPTEIRWEDVSYSMAIDRDIGNNPIVTSVRRQPDQLPQKPFKAKLLTLSKNESTYQAGIALAFENSVNSDAFQGAAPTEVRCINITPTNVYTVTAAYVSVAYTFEFRPINIWGNHPHQLRFLDADTMAYATIGEETKLVQLATSSGQVDRPVLLDGKGRPIDEKITYIDATGAPVDEPVFAELTNPSGATVESSPEGDGYFLIYPIYEERAFSALGLPDVAA